MLSSTRSNARVEHVPRLRQRVVDARLFDRRVSWTEDPSFSLDYHLRHVRAPHPGSLRTVLDLCAPWSTSVLDPARPQWECTVVDGFEGGRAAFVLKFHHTITDGVGGVDLAGSVFDTSRDGSCISEGAGDAPPAQPGTTRTPLQQAGGVLRAGVDAIRRPTQAAAAGLRFGRSVARMLAPVPEPLSPVLHGRSLDRRLDVLELPMTGLQAAAHLAGGTINDMFLAGLGGGFHEYHSRLGHAVPALRITMPISLRAENDPPGGNRFTPARFVLAIDDPDPVARARIAGAIARRWRSEPAVGLTNVLATVLDRLPASMATPLLGSMLKNVDIDAVDVPGLREPAYVGGASIERMWAFAPPTGAAVSVTLLSHLDTACISVLSDLAAVSDPELLLTCLENAFDEVLALGLSHTNWSCS